MEIYSAGFTKHGAREFFGLLAENNIEQLVDIRLNNTSQLASFAKRDDLEFFLSSLLSASYFHEPLLAPSKELLDAYKKHNGDWEVFEVGFIQLMKDRNIQTSISRELFRPRTVLLCSEHTAERCHRRLVLEYLSDQWGDVQAIHL
jgi:uncharacterized protein (DUF488 family)